MPIDVSVKIGGEAGQGIQSVGNLIALACRESGFYMMAINDFESRIRGGHSFFQIRISDRPVHAPADRLDLLIGLNRETFDLHKHELKDQGLAIIEGETGKKNKKYIAVPFNAFGKQAGDKI
jgi:2-oxoglutarate ferredoxin oxidoreductase subunit alpha